MNRDNIKIVGLIPAGGYAKRIAPLPCSKEIYPVGFHNNEKSGDVRPKVVSHFLLEKLRYAGINKVYIVLRNGKWDIPAYLGDGASLNMQLAYLITEKTDGVPYTLTLAYHFVRDAVVAFGFPDIIFEPSNAFELLIERLHETRAEIVLGLFITEEPHKWDMIDFDIDGRVRQIVSNPGKTHLRYTWAIAVWTPGFTAFMRKYLSSLEEQKKQDIMPVIPSVDPELSVGDVIQAAVNNDVKVETIRFSDHACLDIGTPDDLMKAVRSMM